MGFYTNIKASETLAKTIFNEHFKPKKFLWFNFNPIKDSKYSIVDDNGYVKLYLRTGIVVQHIVWGNDYIDSVYITGFSNNLRYHVLNPKELCPEMFEFLTKQAIELRNYYSIQIMQVN
jgi:hypothetical protein